jgi:choline-glycine betaine transporter
MIYFIGTIAAFPTWARSLRGDTEPPRTNLQIVALAKSLQGRLMPLKPPLSSLPINTAETGFYKGFSVNVTLTSKIIVAALILWAVIFPEASGRILNDTNGFILTHFATWYVYVMAGFVLACLGLALWPAAGRLRLGHDGERPEFSNFSWFSMMFGAGIGVGMLTWAVAEPIYHFSNNPDVILGHAQAGAENNVLNAYKWSFLHWGLSAWSSYAITGLALPSSPIAAAFR